MLVGMTVLVAGLVWVVTGAALTGRRRMDVCLNPMQSRGRRRAQIAGGKVS